MKNFIGNADVKSLTKELKVDEPAPEEAAPEEPKIDIGNLLQMIKNKAEKWKKANIRENLPLTTSPSVHFENQRKK